MKTSLICEIRGMHFRLNDLNNPSPAKLLVEMLPGGTELELVREPQNEHDANAIQVWLPASSYPEDWLDPEGEFAARLAGYGWDLDRLRDAPELMLGYVAKERAEVLAPMLDAWLSPQVEFCISGLGKPAVQVNFEE